jgi:hypothetical protein
MNIKNYILISLVIIMGISASVCYADTTVNWDYSISTGPYTKTYNGYSSGSAECATIGRSCTAAYPGYGSGSASFCGSSCSVGWAKCGDVIGTGVTWGKGETHTGYSSGDAECAAQGRGCISAWTSSGTLSSCSSANGVYYINGPSHYTALCGDVVGIGVTWAGSSSGDAECLGYNIECSKAWTSSGYFSSCGTVQPWNGNPTGDPTLIAGTALCGPIVGLGKSWNGNSTGNAFCGISGTICLAAYADTGIGGIGASFCATVYFGGSALCSAPPPSGKSLLWNDSENNPLVYLWDKRDTGTMWLPALGQRNVGITYYISVTAGTGGATVNGKSVPAGTLITESTDSKNPTTVAVNDNLVLHFIPHNYTDIYWTGIGYAGDSPYGEWKAGAAPPGRTCVIKDFIGNIAASCFSTQPYSVYIPLEVNPPAESISNTTNMSCGTFIGDETNGYSMICNVKSAGTLNPLFNFSPTFGEFYYRYYNPYLGFGCQGNPVALNSTNSGFNVCGSNPTGTYKVNVACNNSTNCNGGSLGGPIVIPYTLKAVYPSLTASCTGSPSSGTAPLPVTWTATPGGGNGTYTYSWTGTDGLSGTAIATSKTYTTVGRKNASITVTSGGSSVTATCHVDVNPTLTASCTGSPSSGTAPLPVTWTATPSGADKYSWVGTDGLSGNSITASKTYSTTGTKHATVTVTSGTSSANGTCSVTVNPPVTASCSASPSSVDTGEIVTWTATGGGGNGTYTYSWTGTDSFSGSPVQKTYSTTGKKTETVTVTSGTSSATANCSANVSISAPSATDLHIGTDYCSSAGAGFVTFYWTYNGTYTEEDFKIEIDTSFDFSSSNKMTFDALSSPLLANLSTIHNSFGPMTVLGTLANPVGGDLAFNTPYYWRVLVYDKNNSPSAWVDGASFRTPPYALPHPVFAPVSSSGNSSATLISGKANFNFVDSSTCYSYDGSSHSCTCLNSDGSYYTQAPCYGSPGNSYTWDFGDASAVDTTVGSTSHDYTSAKIYTPSLTITNYAGSCQVKGTATVRGPSNVPEWKEVSPF